MGNKTHSFWFYFPKFHVCIHCALVISLIYFVFVISYDCAVIFLFSLRKYILQYDFNFFLFLIILLWNEIFLSWVHQKFSRMEFQLNISSHCYLDDGFRRCTMYFSKRIALINQKLFILQTSWNMQNTNSYNFEILRKYSK